MDNWSLAVRILVGTWGALLLILLFKVWAAITGNYTVNWSQELGFWMPMVITSAGALAALTSRSAARGRGASAGAANDTDRNGE
jgi:hypothetical protein